MNTDRAFSAMSIAKGSNAAFLFYMADDGRIFGIGTEPPIYGKEAAAKRFAEHGNGDPAANVLSWSPEHADVSADATVGWTDGVWTFVGAPNENGVRPKASGHYLTVWKKDAEGEWKLAADMGTMNPAPK
ncbi:MAG: nuclear transport factor 2 family protein [Alphaproteobacteria bacterium]|nr:nuclear transport factor 2 family protein [Alphaproteobacteria bacterium]MDE2161562.1 nuclear transport factor 2 family protein [Alphaproteobacteria bacterium]MDE2266100.1 nuclear transport factor 2 family protein [Alphaproteobacteria bacterium]MDE2498799.1 nuclear transport factor 2 family protein [Alphaproteobacteria bacterium]